MNAKKKSLNSWVANILANALSSMWSFWTLSVILVVAAFLHPPSNTYEWVMFVISASFQALALPVLAFVSDIQSDRQNKIINSTHQMAMEELKLIKEQQAKLEELIKSEQKRFRSLSKDVDIIDDKIEKVDAQID